MMQSYEDTSVSNAKSGQNDILQDEAFCLLIQEGDTKLEWLINQKGNHTLFLNGSICTQETGLLFKMESGKDQKGSYWGVQFSFSSDWLSQQVSKQAFVTILKQYYCNGKLEYTALDDF